MNWLQRKIYLYNVTFGLYMLDWWERCLFRVIGFGAILRDRYGIFATKLKQFSVLWELAVAEVKTALQPVVYLYGAGFCLAIDTLVIILMWYVFYNGSRKLSEFCNSSLGYACPQASIKRYLWRGA